MATESEPLGKRDISAYLPFWSEDITPKVTPKVRNFLEGYSNIPSDQVIPHIEDIRKRLFDLRPYPCTGLAGFLTPAIPAHPSYPSLLARLKEGALFVEVGTFIGQDIRKLVVDGVPQENIIALDITDHWQLGYDFFNDADKFHVKFLLGDILNPDAELQALKGKVDILQINHVLHQWGWDTQVQACKIITELVPVGGCVVGYQGGSSDIESREEWNKTEFLLHDVKSFKKMWDVIAQETGTKWQCDVDERPWSELDYTDEECKKLGDDFVLLRFIVTRLE